MDHGGEQSTARASWFNNAQILRYRLTGADKHGRTIEFFYFVRSCSSLEWRHSDVCDQCVSLHVRRLRCAVVGGPTRYGFQHSRRHARLPCGIGVCKHSCADRGSRGPCLLGLGFGDVHLKRGGLQTLREALSTRLQRPTSQGRNVARVSCK